MRVIRGVPLIFVVCACTHVPLSTSSSAILPSEANKAERELDGVEVTLRGWIALRFEDKNIWDSKKSHEVWRWSECVSLVNYYLLEGMETEYDGKYVEVTGIFRRDADQGGRVVRLGACGKSGIELISGRPPKIIKN